MKLEMLQLLVAARRRNQPAVLVRGLASGRQVLIDDTGAHGDTGDVPDQLLQRAREALHYDGAVTLEVAQERYLLQTLSSPPRLIIIGAVHIAQALIPMARIAGYEVQLIDPRAAFASPERFPGTDIVNKWPQEIMEEVSWDSRTAVVTLSHDAKIDEPALKAALESDAFYIGALGSKNNHAKRLKRLAEHGFDDAALARIAGPIGLPIGGRSPAEIAVSILAQIIQSRRGVVQIPDLESRQGVSGS
jgi:xanthine dehydrogenase accessory factor